MKRLIIAILLLVTVQFSFGQKKTNTINWEENKPLTWEDFKGRANSGSPHHAYTYGGINVNYENVSGSRQKMLLQIYFDKKKSWLKKGKATDELLKHEQNHFDIIEIYARILVKRIEESKALESKNYGVKVNKVFNTVNKELWKFQEQYDKETDHSKNKDKQKEWNQKLQNMLNEYKEFAKREVLFKI